VSNTHFERKKQMNQLPVENWINRNGTADRECSCGPWKRHWERFSEESWPQICYIRECNRSAEDGAHVENYEEPCGEWIVPTCHQHNETTETFSLKDEITLVNANKSETCENTNNRPTSRPMAAKTGILSANDDYPSGYVPGRVGRIVSGTIWQDGV
jgi:hypothetical protein